MAFNTNQVRHLYIAKALDANVDTLGDITFKNTNDEIYFVFKGEGGKVRSDLIPVKNITSIKAIKASATAPKAKSTEVVLDSNVNGGAPVAGQHYFLNVSIRQYVGMADEETAERFGEVFVTPNMTASEFYKKMALSLVANMSKEITPLLKVSIYNSTTSAYVEVTPKANLSSYTATKIKIEEVAQPYRRGIMAQVPVYYTVTTPKIMINATGYNWGTITESYAASGNNSHNIMDLEYFCMGERGDIYRGMNWPNNIETKYMAGEETYGYHLIEIHYFFEEGAENPQKSERDITIAVPAEGATTYTAINAMIGANTSAANTINKALNSAGSSITLAQLS